MTEMNETTETNVEVITLTQELEKEILGDIKPYTDEAFDAFWDYCEDRNISFYAAPKEDFYIAEAIEQAVVDGNTKVIVENMS